MSIRNAVLAATMTLTPIAAEAYAFYPAATFFGTSNPSGPYTFGTTNGSVFTPLGAYSDCAPSLRCLLSDSEPALGFYKNTTNSPLTAFSTVNVPASGLFFHPGPTSQAYIQFTAPVSSTYQVEGLFQLLSNSTITGTTINRYLGLGGAPSLVSSASLSANSPFTFFNNYLYLSAGDTVIFSVDNAGDYTFDSTLVQVQVSQVPEPATWTSLIVGFGLIGAARRRRRPTIMDGFDVR